MAICNHHNVAIMVIHGLGCGIFVEGCTRWQMEENWKYGWEYVNPTIIRLLTLFGFLKEEEDTQQVEKGRDQLLESGPSELMTMKNE
mmetsp:Transcript_5415/g.9106  ORF Transcript_5415/g.9106 Transcript_5415/m.9106 type:complete len:87 (+) Transcript_5415:1008-1268(+)